MTITKFSAVSFGIITPLPDDEYERVMRAINAGAKSILMKTGELMSLTPVPDIILTERLLANAERKMREAGKFLCAYGNTHWSTENCKCTTPPGQSSTEEMEQNRQRRLAYQAKRDQLLLGMAVDGGSARVESTSQNLIGQSSSDDE